MKRLISLSIFIFIASIALGQLRLDTSNTVEDLVKKQLLQSNSDLFISNIRFTGLNYSIASFTNESPEELIDAGIILSTGNVFSAKGPNSATNVGTQASARRDVDLQAIATGVVIDAVVLEFDLIALRDSIEFTYVFASEEYPEYVDKGVNDVFGFFIEEIGARGVRPLNIARLPKSNQKVTIDNVNHRRNEEFFLRSDYLSAHNNAFWEQNKSMMMRARIFEFDGFTVPLKAVAKLKQGKKYHLKMAIADVGDRYFDSAVLIKAKSLSSKGPRIEKADSIVMEEVKKSMNFSEQISFDENLNFSLQINFDVNDATIMEESLAPLKQLVALMNQLNSLKVDLIGHTDSDGDTQSNQILSTKRAETVKAYLQSKGINADRLSSTGKGELSPIESNETISGKAMNRRVEFQLSY
ncbi:MAG: OmpA family protein [Vicingaceae bacterium]